ncbi:MAG: hypothetical protein J5979_00680 [Lachnospiraceae bacterium]|nr:hypothetical protein [Lachnospiraceae bacterium]
MLLGKKYHPFRNKDNRFKYIYCFGLGVMSMGHMKAITETQDYFYEVLEQIALPEEDRQKILIDINNHFERRIEDVFVTISNKEEQYCFVMDLYQILKRTSWAKSYCSQVLENYLQVFQLSAMERIFFQEFSHAAEEQDMDRARKASQCFMEEGYVIRYDFLTWFYPGFIMEEEYEGLVIPAGKTVILDKPTQIHGDMIVERGGSLLIQGAVLKMQGCIQVNGGRVQIDHGEIYVLSCHAPFWLMLRDTAVVTIVDTMIDCHNQCGVLWQNMGRLLIEESWFRHTAVERAVVFSGQSIKISHTHFQQGTKGMIGLSGSAQAKIIQCDFKDASAEYGGAISSESIGEVFVQQCTFLRCQAKYLGNAVYFKHQKLGQNVMECSCQDCLPEGSDFFNLLS